MLDPTACQMISNEITKRIILLSIPLLKRLDEGQRQGKSSCPQARAVVPIVENVSHRSRLTYRNRISFDLSRFRRAQVLHADLTKKNDEISINSEKSNDEKMMKMLRTVHNPAKIFRRVYRWAWKQDSKICLPSTVTCNKQERRIAKTRTIHVQWCT